MIWCYPLIKQFFCNLYEHTIKILNIATLGVSVNQFQCIFCVTEQRLVLFSIHYTHCGVIWFGGSVSHYGYKDKSSCWKREYRWLDLGQKCQMAHIKITLHGPQYPICSSFTCRGYANSSFDCSYPSSTLFQSRGWLCLRQTCEATHN